MFITMNQEWGGRGYKNNVLLEGYCGNPIVRRKESELVCQQWALKEVTDERDNYEELVGLGSRRT